MSKIKLFVCEYCIAAIKSRGEKIAVEDWFDHTDMEPGYCEWCHSEVPCGEIKRITFV